MRALRIALWGFGGLVALLLAYGLAGMIGAAVPTNTGWRETPGGIEIGIETNGIHTGIVLPLVGHGADWRGLVRADHLADPRYAGTHLAFGWGERRFYLETPTWADLKPSTVVAAAVGSGATLLHVDHLTTGAPAQYRRTIRVSQGEYDAIVAAIRARFRLDPRGFSQPIAGYGPADIFYESVGRYDALTTCNSWVGTVLRDAGVRVGAWTPFSGGVMAWFGGGTRRYRLAPPQPLT